MIPDSSIPVLDHGFVRLDAAMADDLSVVNAARVSFARRREEVDDADAGLIRFLMRDRHGCYDDATEVLTGAGWKRWPDVTGEESFATRSVDGRLEYQPALRLVRKDYKGHMIGFKGMSLDLLVTPDHRVLTCRHDHTGRAHDAAFSSPTSALSALAASPACDDGRVGRRGRGGVQVRSHDIPGGTAAATARILHRRRLSVVVEAHRLQPPEGTRDRVPSPHRRRGGAGGADVEEPAPRRPHRG